MYTFYFKVKQHHLVAKNINYQWTQKRDTVASHQQHQTVSRTQISTHLENGALNNQVS